MTGVSGTPEESWYNLHAATNLLATELANEAILSTAARSLVC